MKQIVLLLIFISGCGVITFSGKEAESTTIWEVYTLNEVTEGLIKFTGDSNALVMVPLQEYVFELGVNATGTFLFDRDGQRLRFKLCFADYPSPLKRNLDFLLSPKVVPGETIVEFIEKLNDFNKSKLMSNEFDFTLFFTWSLKETGKYDPQRIKIHKALSDDIKETNESGFKIQLVHLYVGNLDEFLMPPDTFLLKKIEYMKALMDK